MRDELRVPTPPASTATTTPVYPRLFESEGANRWMFASISITPGDPRRGAAQEKHDHVIRRVDMPA